MANIKLRYTPEETNHLLSEIQKRIVKLDNGCVEWSGTTQDEQPSLAVRLNGRRIYATPKRFLYVLFNSIENASNTLPVYNTCGNPKCVNPHHLAEGVGIGSSGYERAKRALRTWYFAQAKGASLAEISENIGITKQTLVKYIKLFKRNPEQWIALWSKE